VLATLGNGAWPAVLQNLSAGGARLQVVRPGCPLRPGRVLELALHNRTRGLRVAARLRLTHSTERAGGDVEVGGAFDDPLPPSALEALSAVGPR
jgi:hypothetical protein